MPVYEYACQACGHEFEELILGSETPTCPTCESAELAKKFSSFAVGADAPSAACDIPSPACGTCDEPGMGAGCPMMGS